MKNNLKLCLDQAGITERELADYAGIMPGRIYQMKTNGAVPTLEEAYAISAVLDCSITNIWPNEIQVEEREVVIRKVVVSKFTEFQPKIVEVE